MRRRRFVVRRTIAAWSAAAVATVMPLVGGSVAMAQGDAPIARFADPAIIESSGLAASGRDADLVWTHNDKGNDAVLFAVSLDPAAAGRTVARVRLQTPEGVNLVNVDTEDLARRDDPERGPLLYLADIGDGDADRRSVQVHLVAEPDLTAAHEAVIGGGSLADLVLTVVTMEFRYEDGPANAEALAVLPSGRVVVITKTPGVDPVLYVSDGVPAVGADNVLTRVASFSLVDPPPPLGPESSPPPGRFLITAADVSPDGTVLAARTYGDVLVWPVPVEDLQATLQVRPTRVLLPASRMGEGLAFTADGAALLTSSEGEGAPLFRVPLPEVPVVPPWVEPTAWEDEGFATSAPVGEVPEPTSSPAPDDENRQAGSIVTLLVVAGLAGAAWAVSRRVS